MTKRLQKCRPSRKTRPEAPNTPLALDSAAVKAYAWFMAFAEVLMPAALPSFDVLLNLAQHDRAGLERLRDRLCEQVIAQARSPEAQARLRGLQWRIEGECRRARTPMAACLRLNGLMLDSLWHLQAAFNDGPEPQASARVLAFRPRH